MIHSGDSCSNHQTNILIGFTHKSLKTHVPKNCMYFHDRGWVRALYDYCCRHNISPAENIIAMTAVCINAYHFKHPLTNLLRTGRGLRDTGIVCPLSLTLNRRLRVWQRTGPENDDRGHATADRPTWPPQERDTDNLTCMGSLGPPGDCHLTCTTPLNSPKADVFNRSLDDCVWASNRFRAG